MYIFSMRKPSNCHNFLLLECFHGYPETMFVLECTANNQKLSHFITYLQVLRRRDKMSKSSMSMSASHCQLKLGDNKISPATNISTTASSSQVIYHKGLKKCWKGKKKGLGHLSVNGHWLSVNGQQFYAPHEHNLYKFSYIK